MDVRQAKCFIAVADLKSFSLASKILNLTQPAVSIQIKNLEQEYRTTFFQRERNNLKLTSAGKIYYEFAKKVIDQERNYRDQIYQLKGDVSGELLLGASGIPGEYILPRILPGFLKQHPQVSVKMILSDTAEITQKVLQKNIDIGFVGYKIKYKDLHYKFFTRDELVVILPKSFRMKNPSSLRLKDLRGKPLVIQNTGSGIRMLIEEKLHEAKLSIDDFQIAAEFHGVESVKKAVESHLGFAFISKWAVEAEKKSRPFYIYPILGIDTRRNFLIVTHALSPFTSVTKSFLNYLSTHSVSI